MILKDFAIEQVGRLSGLQKFPEKSMPAVMELAIALQIADTDAIAREVIGEFAQNEGFCPAPADIRRACYRLNEQYGHERPICNICNGIGFIHSYWLITYERGYTRREVLPFRDADSYMNYCADMRLAPKSQHRQDVQSACKPCVCHAPPQAEEPATPRRRRAS